MKKGKREEQKATEADFYVVHNGLFDAEREQAVRDNLRDFSVSVVKGREETGQRGTALVLRGGNDQQWFEANRPDLTVTYLSGTTIQALTNLYGLFGRTLPPILQEGDRLFSVAEASVAEAVEPDVLEWAPEN